MLSKIVLSPAFRRSYKKFTRRNRTLQKSVDDAILAMELDPFAPFLQTHKLGGKYLGLLGCSCGYDCRIVFRIEKEASGLQKLILTDIGTHNDVY
jgi:mRNA interferase YafQ